MNSEEMNALDRVINHYGDDELKHYKDAGKPNGHIAESLMALLDYRRNCPPPSPVEEVVKERPEDSRGPSVWDRGSKQMVMRWAKEAIGLTAIELNEAYAEFEFTRYGTTIPSGHLHQASERLGEIIKRLGITGDDLPF